MKIALIGYGKMGKEIEKLARSRGHEIVSVIDVHNQEDFESEAFRSADVAIEFTNPEAAYNNCVRTFRAGVKLVSGSTGWMEEHGDEIREMCAKEGKTLFWASNFSLGVAIFSALNNYLAKIMNRFPEYDVTMSETHHIHKVDAPSGTAITLAEGVLGNIDRKETWVKGEARRAEELPIVSVREGEVVGIHTIQYESSADTISVTHDARNRGGFVSGAVLAAEFIADKRGFLGMNDLFPFLTNKN
jgi:4-hydroxy-tetrahydrodipicolinate reductase